MSRRRPTRGRFICSSGNGTTTSACPPMSGSADHGGSCRREGQDGSRGESGCRDPAGMVSWTGYSVVQPHTRHILGILATRQNVARMASMARMWQVCVGDRGPRCADWLHLQLPIESRSRPEPVSIASHADPFPRLPDCITRERASATISRISRVPCPAAIARACRSVPTSVKNGAPLRFPRAEAGSMRLDATDVKSVILAGCDLEPSGGGRAKWRFRPSKKLPFGAIFHHDFDDFGRVFPRAFPSGANRCARGPENAGFEPRPIANGCAVLLKTARGSESSLGGRQ